MISPRYVSPETTEPICAYSRQLVSVEPGYVPAWVDLAHAAFGQMMLGVSPAKVMPAGLDAAYRAVSADPHLAEAHRLGRIIFPDGDGSERRTSTATNPS
jgi:hypothetical protein